MPQARTPEASVRGLHVPAATTHEAELSITLDPGIECPGIQRRERKRAPSEATLCFIAYFQLIDSGSNGYFNHVTGDAEPPSDPEYDMLECYIWNWDARQWRPMTTLDHKMLDQLFGPGTTDGIYEYLETNLEECF